MELHLIHFPKAGSQSSQNLSDFGPLVFETCLRRIVFLNAEASVQNPVVQQDCNLETYALEQAYRFTLEVICGLHSLIKGETEIFGQFKDFVSDNKNQIEALGLTPVFQQLLADCKFLRNTHIQH